MVVVEKSVTTTHHGPKIKLATDATVDCEGLVVEKPPLEQVLHLGAVERGCVFGSQRQLLVFKNLFASLLNCSFQNLREYWENGDRAEILGFDITASFV